MTRISSFLLTFVILLSAGVLLGWNVSRFIGAQAIIRAKDLDFLPPPETARVLALGHTNTLAKLRWIDSFAYFQYQLDVKNDSVEGGGTGFKRLYETLISLDPKFQPFYEHAAMNTSGVLGQHWISLSFLMRGNLELPKSRELWRNTATILKTFFHWDTQQPLLFDAVLTEWEMNEELPEAKRMVWDWKRGFGSFAFTGLEQLPYWLDQLKVTKPHTPNGDFVDATIRELIARYGAQELSWLLTGWRIRHGVAPRDRQELADFYTFIDPFMLPVTTDPVPESINQILDARLLHHRYPHGLPDFGPLVLHEGRIRLKMDPYGLPWVVHDEKVISSGYQREAYEKLLGRYTAALLKEAQKRSYWPQTLDEVAQLNLLPPDPPQKGALKLDDHRFLVEWMQEPASPWRFRNEK